MRRGGQVVVLALSPLLAAAGTPTSDRAPAEPSSLAERIDLTRITVLEADYARAAAQRNTRDLATYEHELAAMLRDEVLAYAGADVAPPAAATGGTGGAAAAPERGPGGTPAVAVDEEEVGAASLDAKVVALAREFLSLEGKLDGASLARKASLVGSLQALSARAQFPGTAPSAEQGREARQRVGQERRERQEREDLPAK
jgi:hypothetical protein